MTATSLPRLSPRLRELLAHLAAGDSNADIARALWLSEDTVRTHVRRLLKALEARNRTHAVAVAYQLGLLTPPITTEETR